MWSDVSPEAFADNGATGTAVHIIYQNNQQPPHLPIAVIVKFDSYKGPAFVENQPMYVPMDFMGPIRETVHGNWYILVLMDHFSKWCEAFHTKDQKASTVADILLQKVFSHFGPQVLHSDQGANFESNLMHELCVI